MADAAEGAESAAALLAAALSLDGALLAALSLEAALLALVLVLGGDDVVLGEVAGLGAVLLLRGAVLPLLPVEPVPPGAVLVPSVEPPVELPVSDGRASALEAAVPVPFGPSLGLPVLDGEEVAPVDEAVGDAVGDAVEVADSLDVAEGELLGESGASGPCSVSMIDMICCSYAVRRSCICESGTSVMCLPKSAMSCQTAAMLFMPSSLSGPSRVRNSWVASA